MTSTELNFQVPPPGSYIEEEIAARGWSQTDLAYILGVSVQSLNPIITGKRSISTDMAKALGEAFDVPAELFSNLQATYDLSKSEDPDPAIARRARLQEHFPIREMVKRGWLDDRDRDVDLLEAQLMRFFQTTQVDSIPYMSHAAKKSRYEMLEVPPVQLAWLFRVHQIASELSIPKYSEQRLRKSLDGLHSLMTDPAEIRHVPKILEECGVRLVVVEALPNAKIDGVCFWIDNQKPVIGLSLRFDRIDNFWFVLRHEIEHVLQKHGLTDPIFDDLEGSRSGQGDELPEEERIANRAAAEFCTPSDKLDSFYQRKRPYLSERDIVGFARRLQVHPGIVIGQIHRKTGDYRLLRRYLVKVREYVTPYVVSDGWGDVFPVEL